MKLLGLEKGSAIDNLTALAVALPCPALLPTTRLAILRARAQAEWWCAGQQLCSTAPLLLGRRCCCCSLVRCGGGRATNPSDSTHAPTGILLRPAAIHAHPHTLSLCLPLPADQFIISPCDRSLNCTESSSRRPASIPPHPLCFARAHPQPALLSARSSSSREGTREPPTTPHHTHE